MQTGTTNKPKFDMEKAKKLLNDSKEENKEIKKEKVITIAEVKTLIEQLQFQMQKLTKEVNEKQTMAIKTQGAIEVATAQLQGLEDDSKPTN